MNALCDQVRSSENTRLTSLPMGNARQIKSEQVRILGLTSWQTGCIRFLPTTSSTWRNIACLDQSSSTAAQNIVFSAGKTSLVRKLRSETTIRATHPRREPIGKRSLG